MPIFSDEGDSSAVTSTALTMVVLAMMGFFFYFLSVAQTVPRTADNSTVEHIVH